MHRENILKILFVLFSALMSFLIWSSFEGGLGFFGMSELLKFAVLITLSVSVFFLSFVLFSKKFSFLTFFAFIFVFLAIFNFGYYYLIFSIIAFLLFYFAYIRFSMHFKNSIKLKLHMASFFGIPSLVTSVAILFSVASYFYPFNIDELKVSENMVVPMSSVLEGAVKTKFPFYQKDMTLDDFLAEIVADNIGVSANLVKNNFQKEINNQKRELSKSLKVELTGKETFNQIVVKIVNSYINKFVTPNQAIVPFVLAILIFLTIKSLGFLLNRLSVFFSWVIIKFLMFFNIVKTEKIQIEKEKLIVS